MAKLIPNRYADAFFELAQEQGKVDELAEEAEYFLDALRQNRELTSFMVHPQITASQKSEAVRNIFAGQVSDTMLGFTGVVFYKKREDQLADILDAFLAKVKEYKGIVTAKVTTALPLTEAQIARVAELLTHKLALANTARPGSEPTFGPQPAYGSEPTFGPRVEIVAVTDPSVIGGISIQAEGRVFDATLKKKIGDIKTLCGQTQSAPTMIRGGTT
ncbi:MAG: ATP synthase F1 subunit delta [Clostridiales bacterium]|jgi:F-type H+-transporting ATPase subunit delta|nr:ATP synthase F1 subunit delta [Clostridiales bacterium]